MGSARWKLVSLWFSQTARVTADNALRFFVCLEYARQSEGQQNSAWYLVTAIFTMPAVFLAPFNGAICNTLPKSQVLRWTAFYGFAVMVGFAFLHAFKQDYWITCWALISIGSAIYGPTRYAMLPAASVDTRWPLSRINGFIEMGTFSAVLAGFILILVVDWEAAREISVWLTPVILVLLLNGIAFATALPVQFPSDVRREEPPWQAVVDFFADFRRIWKIRDARIAIIGLSAKRGLVIGMAGAMIAIMFKPDGLKLVDFAYPMSLVAAGVAVGSLLAGLQKHPRRILGLVPIGGVGFTFGMAYAAGGDRPDEWFCVIAGFAAGLINVPLASTYQAAVPADARGNAMAVRNLTDYVCATIAAIMLFLLSHFAGFDGPMQLWVIAAFSLLGTIAAWWFFRRELTEQIIEVAFAIMYRFRAAGPGLESFPLKGPVIVVANHSSYMDPMWLAKVLPRTMIPMMTSVYFDHWLLRWTMIYLFDAIRVEASGFRRDIPELQKAIETLDAGKCLVLFPEGRLRRKTEQPLKLFGQGIWHILRERPDTPVVICWIEGGFGCYFSYFQGPPMTNKTFDIARPIGIAVGEPQVLGAETLADHRKLRQYLMEQCLEARKFLGLEPLVVEAAEMTAEE